MSECVSKDNEMYVTLTYKNGIYTARDLQRDLSFGVCSRVLSKHKFLMFMAKYIRRSSGIKLKLIAETNKINFEGFAIIRKPHDACPYNLDWDYYNVLYKNKKCTFLLNDHVRMLRHLVGGEFKRNEPVSINFTMVKG